MGQVPYEVCFVDRKFWFYNIIQSYLVDGLPSAATLHSRFMFVTEFACGFLRLQPMRTASWVALTVILGIALINNFLLLSIITSLVGLAMVGLHQPKNKSLLPIEPA